MRHSFRIGNTYSRTHGMTNTPEFHIWDSMKARCYNKNCKGYKYYGARGISVCKQWRYSFENFFADMGKRPSPKHQIDRINNNKGYYPNNCRWITSFENANNRRSSKLIKFKGKTLSLEQWARRIGVCGTTISRRLQAGWPIKAALTRISSHKKRCHNDPSIPI